MLGFDNEFQNGTSKITKAWVNLTLTDGTSLEYHEDRVMFNGITRDSSTTVDGQFTVGAAVTGKMTVMLDNSDDVLSAYDFRDATMIVWLGGILADGSMQKVNVGRYYIDEYTYDGLIVTLVGYDDMARFDVPCKDSSFAFSQNTTINDLIGYAISSNVAGIPLYNAELPVPEGIKITQQPEQWDTMTWHDVIAYCAQIMCCYAYIVWDAGTYKLKFAWYDTGALLVPLWDGGTFNHFVDYTDGGSLDGGTFDTGTTPYSDGDAFDGGSFSTNTTPYSDGGDISGGIIQSVIPYPDGVVLDGGTFNPWNEGDWADGGIFGDRDTTHVVHVPYDMSVDTDDIMITGVSVTLDPSENIDASDDTQIYTASMGEAGYVIGISDNPLIETTGIADIVCGYLYSVLNGMRFRVLEASVIGNPDITAGDTAYVNGRNDVTYPCFISHVTYTVNSATSISCDAESGKQNLKPRFTGSQKTQALIQTALKKAVSSVEEAMNSALSSYASSMGLYPYPQSTSSGTIYIYGNHNTLEASDIRWRFSAGSLAVSTDYGQHWNAALSSDGIAALNRIYAVGINADYIEAGDLSLGGLTKNVDGNLFLYDAYGDLRVTMNKNGIYSGKTHVNDFEHTGFYLSNDGLIVGDANNDLYFQALKTGEINIRDNPTLYPEEYASGIVNTTFTITSDLGSTQLGSVYSCFSGDVTIEGTLDVEGVKARLINTANYARRRLYAYETAEPTFGDIGEGVIGDDGKCYIDIDPILADTICDSQYQVFLQKYGSGDVYILERSEDYFIVGGTVGLAFGWELKAKQINYSGTRMGEPGIDDCLNPSEQDDLDYIDMLEAEMYGGIA